MLTSSILVQETELIYQKKAKNQGFFFYIRANKFFEVFSPTTLQCRVTSHLDYY